MDEGIIVMAHLPSYEVLAPETVGLACIISCADSTTQADLCSEITVRRQRQCVLDNLEAEDVTAEGAPSDTAAPQPRDSGGMVAGGVAQAS